MTFIVVVLAANITFEIFNWKLGLWKSQWRQWTYCWWHAMLKLWIYSSNRSCEWSRSSWKIPTRIYRSWPRIRLAHFSYLLDSGQRHCEEEMDNQNPHISHFSSSVLQTLKRIHRHIIGATISSFRNSLPCAMATMITSSCGTPFEWLAFVASKVWFVRRCPMIWWRIFGTSSTWRK